METLDHKKKKERLNQESMYMKNGVAEKRNKSPQGCWSPTCPTAWPRKRDSRLGGWRDHPPHGLMLEQWNRP